MKLKFVFKVWHSSKGVWREIQLQIFQISPHQTILKRLRIIVVLLLLMLSAKCPIWWSLFGTVRTLERRQKMLGICLVLCAFRFFFSFTVYRRIHAAQLCIHLCQPIFKIMNIGIRTIMMRMTKISVLYYIVFVCCLVCTTW